MGLDLLAVIACDEHVGGLCRASVQTTASVSACGGEEGGIEVDVVAVLPHGWLRTAYEGYRCPDHAAAYLARQAPAGKP